MTENILAVQKNPELIPNPQQRGRIGYCAHWKQAFSKDTADGMGGTKGDHEI